MTCRVLRSSLSAAEAQRAREKIEKGFEKEAAVLRDESQESERGTERATAVAAAGDSLFSSDSDASGGDDERERAEPPEAERATPEEQQPHSETAKAAVAVKQPRKKQPAKQSAKSSEAAESTSTDRQRENEAAAVATTSITASQEPAPREKTERSLLPKVKNPLAASETKRPLPRASRIPDLSFFPREVAPICKRVSTHITRSAILDDADYSAFEQQYEAFYADWETLDKVRRVGLSDVHGGVRLTLQAYNRRTRSR